jgi:O-antigen/teichoic acid export membrane protein
MSRPETRVVSGVAAHLYSQSVTVFTQLATLPIFLTRWSTEQYGQWVMISAIPVYLTISDFGILTAAGNLMCMHKARDETSELNRVFKSSLLIILFTVPLLALCAAMLLFAFNFGLNSDQRGALLALMLVGLLTVACGLLDAAYRPFGKYPRITILLTHARLFEWFGTIAGLLMEGTLKSAALGFLTGRSIACVALFALARRDIPEIQWGFGNVDGTVVRRLVRDGLGFFSFPLGTLLTLQGMVVLVGAQLGGSAVALFSSSRTLTRILAQISILTGKAMSPEISALYGAGKHRAVDRLSRRAVFIIVPLTILGAAVLELAGRQLLKYWSRGKLTFDSTVFTLLLVAAVATAYWQIQSVRLTATNRHSFLATIFLIVSALSLLAVFFTDKKFGTSAAAAATCLADVVMVVATIVALRRAQVVSGGRRNPDRAWTGY